MDGSAIQHDHIKLEQKQRFNFIDNHEQTKNGALSKYYLAMFRWQSHNFASPPFLMSFVTSSSSSTTRCVYLPWFSISF